MKIVNWTPSAIKAYFVKHGSYPPGVLDKRTAPTVKLPKQSPGAYSIVMPR